MIWIDIEDLFVHFHAGGRPSGIQRLSLDLTSALIAEGGGRVLACRHGPGSSGFCALDWNEARADLEAAIAGQGSAAVGPERLAGATVTRAASGQDKPVSAIRRKVRQLPHTLLFPLARAYNAERRALHAVAEVGLAQIDAVRAGGEMLLGLWRAAFPGRAVIGGAALGASAAASPATPARASSPTPQLAGRPIRFEEGDVLLAIGATWQFRSYAARVARLQNAGARFAILAHDMVPLLFPEWSVRDTTERFELWAQDVLGAADMIFTNSRATARDVARYAEQRGMTLPEPVPLPIGASFDKRRLQPDARAAPVHPRPYVLFVSTIEPRKNHGALLRLWRRFLTSMPEDAVPDLVFAGKVGWLAHDIVAQAENADWFGGKVRLVEGPDDATLAALYRDCLFTVYPSLYEGWGLPVTESLSFGKPVAAAKRGAIPEAGGPFCAYFDPDDISDMERVVGRLIREPDAVATLATRIEAEFHPPSWAEAARSMLAMPGMAPRCARDADITAASARVTMAEGLSSPANSPAR